MRREVQKYLADILTAGELIQEFSRGKIPADYDQDRLLSSAVERQLTIIGEALNQASKLDTSIASQIASFREIIAFRNLLIHGYGIIKNDTVWGIITDDLPHLLVEIPKMLDYSSE